MHGNELRLFWAKANPYSNYLCRASDIAAVGTISKVFSFAAVSDRDSKLSPSDGLRVEPQVKDKTKFLHKQGEGLLTCKKKEFNQNVFVLRQ